MIVQGLSTSGLAVPLLVDSEGRVIVTSYPHDVYNITGLTQVLKYGEAVNATTTIYTVPTGKVCYLTSLFCHMSNASAVGGVVTVELHNSTPSKQMEWKNAAVAGALNVMSVSFSTPVKLLSDWSVKLVSTVNLQYIRGSITGYEI